MALAKKKLESVPSNTGNKQAANSAAEPTESNSSPKKIFFLALVLGIIIGIAATYPAMQYSVVKSLQESVAFERAQKAAYITANQLDFETLQPRVQALEVANAAKAEKEAILLKTIEDLQFDLKTAAEKVLAAEKAAAEEIKAAKVSAIKALQD